MNTRERATFIKVPEFFENMGNYATAVIVLRKQRRSGNSPSCTVQKAEQSKSPATCYLLTSERSFVTASAVIKNPLPCKCTVARRTLPKISAWLSPYNIHKISISACLLQKVQRFPFYGLPEFDFFLSFPFPFEGGTFTVVGLSAIVS